MMILRVRAHFAVFRPFQAGAYRSTLSVMPPSAAYGLVLNLAGIDARDALLDTATAYRPDAPTLSIATGLFSAAGLSSLYQQLHSYPVGDSGKEFKERTHGAKYWIAPVRRELLVDYDGAVAFESEDPTIEERVRSTLRGQPPGPRYGLPFAGDNNFLFDRIDEVGEQDVTWYVRLDGSGSVTRGSVRLPIRIDRRDQSRTEIELFAPSNEPSKEPPAAAWVSVGP